MNPIFNKRSRYLNIPAIFIAIFCLISILYIEHDARLDRKHFQTHALIIAGDTWALNRNGAKAYLQLAVKADHYQYLVVSIPGDDQFLRVPSAPLAGISLVFHKLGLIGVKDLSENILHEDQTIGTLHGRQYVRVIFPLLNILVVLLLVLLTVTFIIYLFINRKFLEQQVLERTRNLRESERRFHDLVDLLPEMVLETDLNGRIEYFNKAAKERLKIPFTPGSPATFSQFITSEDREKAIQHFQASLADTTAGLEEFIATDPENRTFPILLRTAPIRKDDAVIGARMIVVDITERHRLEEQLLRDQKMKAIGLMAGGVAHDLNNILSGIISYPELLLLDLDEHNRMRRPLEAIRRAGLDAAEVVADLLTVARGIAATREVINLNTLVDDYLASPDFHQLRLRYPLITVSKFLAEDLRHICCSPIHMRKCLMNLVTNGLEAIQGKGTLAISTQNYSQTAWAPQKKQALPEGGYAKIAIYDSGSGIAPHEIEHIFEPFYTKKVMGRSGTGLGLAVVWNTMKDHGGIVNVISDQQGTTFELYLPAVEERALAVSEASDWQTLMGNGEHVLVIDDEPQQRTIAGELLTSLNYRVDVVSSGEEAITYLESHSADILVLDMIMDPGINGRVTYEKILKMHPRQKAVVASGFAEDDDVRATLALGAGAFVGKPYTLEKIGSTIYKILHSC
jgi:two-component system, cell cycle sensor histidine kinase and response regulator CckA